MSIETKMDYLVETKNEIKQAIRDQGTDVSDALPFRQYADKVRNIVTSVDGVDIHEIKRGENMLDNSYWRMGKSIINQRGSTSYVVPSNNLSNYTIDRWIVGHVENGGEARIEIGGRALVYKVSGNTSNVNNYFCTLFRSHEIGLIAGDVVTVSFYFYISSLSTTGDISGAKFFPYIEIIRNGSTIQTITNDTPDVHAGEIHCLSVTGTINDVNDDDYILVGISHTNTEANIHLYAAKLELGSMQTLTREENGVIYMNDPAPNYALELAKCQYYYIKFPYESFVGPAIRTTSPVIVYLPNIPMAKSPSFLISGDIYLYYDDQTYKIDNSQVTGVQYSAGFVTALYVMTPDFTYMHPSIMGTRYPGMIELSAEP